MGLRFAFMKQKFIDWLDVHGSAATYKHVSGTKAIKVDIEEQLAGSEDLEFGRYFVRRAIIRIADDDTFGMLAADIRQTDRITVDGRTWSVLDLGQRDKSGVIALECMHRDEVEIPGRVRSRF